MHKTSNPAPPQKVSGILYDVPYLVRDPNEFRMSEKRHQIEVKNQAVVDAPPDLDRRVDSPALSGRGSRPSGRTSG